MKRTLTFLAIAMISMAAAAAVITGSWVAPTQNTDGSAIPASGPGSLTGYVMEYGPCNAARDALASVTGTVAVAGLTAPTPNLGPGSWCARVRATNTYGVAGEFSDVKFKVIDAPTPGKPTGFTFG